MIWKLVKLTKAQHAKLVKQGRKLYEDDSMGIKGMYWLQRLPKKRK